MLRTRTPPGTSPDSELSHSLLCRHAALLTSRGESVSPSKGLEAWYFFAAAIYSDMSPKHREVTDFGLSNGNRELSRIGTIVARKKHCQITWPSVSSESTLNHHQCIFMLVDSEYKTVDSILCLPERFPSSLSSASASSQPSCLWHLHH